MKKGTKHTAETVEKMRLAKLGKHRSIDCRARIRQAALARFERIRQMEKRMAEAGLL